MNTQTAYRLESYQVIPSSLELEKEFLYVVASLNAKSSDPSAAEILAITQKNGILPVNVEHFDERPGRGIGGVITLPNDKNPRAVLYGTTEYLAQCHFETPDLLAATIADWSREADTRVIVAGWQGWVRGALKLKPR
jgi:cation transport ATPase